MAQNLTRRGAVYYARVAAPKSLLDLRRQRGLSGRLDVWKSLGTRDPATAKRALPAALERIYRAFEAEEARLLAEGARPSADLVVPGEHDLHRATFEFIHEELRLDERGRAARPSRAEIERAVEETRRQFETSPPESDLDTWLRPGGLGDLSALIDGPNIEAERRQVLAETLRAHLADNNYVLIEWAVESLARRNSWRVEQGSSLHKELARHLMRAWIQVLETTFQRDRGVYAEGNISPLPAASPVPRAPAQGTPKKGESLRDYFDQYLKEQKQAAKANARQDMWATLRQFLECSGNRVVTSYTRADIAQFKRMLAKTPARVEKLYPGVPLPRAIERNRVDGNPLLKSNSVRNKLSTLAAFGSWLEANVPGVDAQNFRTTLPPKKDADRMEPFSADEIRQILNSLAFTGCQSERNQLSPGTYKVRDWRYWIVLIAAFTGARLNEITQLKVTDLAHVDGLWTFRITDATPSQSLKNEASRRVVPVHPTLINLGLLEFRERAAGTGQADLFHEVPVDRDGRRSTHAGKWFRKFLTRIGVKREGSLGGAHRWRHTLTDALRHAGVDDYQIAQVLGHKIDAAKMTAHYGREVAMTSRQRHELLSRVRYPSVNFDSLSDAT